MFPEDELFQYVLTGFAEDRSIEPPVRPEPLRCDRYVARSCLQKAIRRGEADLALRALARLLADHPQAIWRHLTTIAIEDVGIGDIDLVARVVAAGRDRAWRTRSGGDWSVAAVLVRQMAKAIHCQAACDLMLVGMYRPGFDRVRADIFDASTDHCAAIIADAGRPVIERGISALALAGCLAEGQHDRDPHAVFDIMAEQGHFSHVVATCRAAWRLTRDPMALMLPFIWQARGASDRAQTADDPMPSVAPLGDLPDYALDQHTRAGSEIARRLLRMDEDLTAKLTAAGIPAAKQPRTIGNLLFLIDGSPCVRRRQWDLADQLRFPHRALPEAMMLGPHLDDILVHLRRQWSVIVKLRWAISPFLPTSTSDVRIASSSDLPS